MLQIMVTTPATVSPGERLVITPVPFEPAPDLPPPWLDYRVFPGQGIIGSCAPENISNTEPDLGKRLALLRLGQNGQQA